MQRFAFPLIKTPHFILFQSGTNLKNFFDGLENTMGEVENANYQLFLLFKQCFQKAFFTTCDYADNSLTNDKILNQSKLKAFANDKINVAEKLKFVSGRVENIVGKGENVDYWHFLLFSQ